MDVRWILDMIKEAVEAFKPTAIPTPSYPASGN